jgi:glutamate/tyrosine decarboxylase-like PLP-dependent enzyme
MSSVYKDNGQSVLLECRWSASYNLSVITSSHAELFDANLSRYTYEVAPVFTLMEQEVMKQMKDLIGFEEADGLFCPGE